MRILLFLLADYASTASAVSLGKYIRAGLGITINTPFTQLGTGTTASAPTPMLTSSISTSSTLTSPTSTLSTSTSSPLSTSSASSASSRTAFNANSSIPYSSLLQCAASWAKYESFTSSDIVGTYATITSSSRSNVSLIYGAGEVYTTTQGIPVASGGFTPTKVVQTVVAIEYLTSTYEIITKVPLGSSPSCASLSPSQCSRLYVSYISSLGLSQGASVPAITPIPTNSPRCPEYFYKPFSNCSYWQDPVNTCWISGANVQLFYFPPKTTSFGSQGGNATSLSYAVVQSYAPGITFTSPSIYLSFDYLSAMSTLGAEESACSSCGWGGCTAQAVGGGDAYQTIGSSISGALLTLRPEDVSTLIAPYNDAEASLAASAIAHGAAGFASIGEDLQYLFSYRAKQLQISAITHPAPTDYYLRPSGAPGCNSSYPSPECSTIFEGLYRPILSLPSQVAGLQGGWKSCLPAIFGVYDPPKALTEVTTMAGVSDIPTHPSKSDHSAAPPHGQTTATLLPATVPTQPTPPSTGSSRSNSAFLPSLTDPSRLQSSRPTGPSAPGTTNIRVSNPNALSVLVSVINAVGASQTHGSEVPTHSVEDVDTQDATTAIVDGHAYTVSRNGQSEVIVNGIPISQGATSTVVETQIVLVESNVVRIGSSTLTIGQHQAGSTGFTAESGAILTLGSSILTVLHDPGVSGADILDGSITLEMGGPTQTFDGVAISAVASGIVDHGTTIPFSALNPTNVRPLESTTKSAESNSASVLATETASTSRNGAGRCFLPTCLVVFSTLCIALLT